MVGVLALLLGVVAMHAGVFCLGAGSHHTMPEHSAIATTALDEHHDTASVGDIDQALAHAGMHPCVFVLSAVALAIGLVLLGRLDWARGDGHRPPLGILRATRQRPPPWTVPSLADLSILRI
ncbi:DUF6153 family protein [Nocardia wallacei]|uniref:DUF6153 family protein n=2 Tax=Nocardia wallacei TaxID=480035 RepID=UPI00313E9D21